MGRGLRALTGSGLALGLLLACGSATATGIDGEAAGSGAVPGAGAALMVSTPTTSADPVLSAIGSAASGTALAAVGTLAVKGRAPKTGYDRAAFGPAWADLDRNGCDTRNDVLRRDLATYVLKPGTNGCLVLRGSLRDPYTGKAIAFVRGPQSSARVQVDHVVALSDAWQKGAQQWSPRLRAQFANDSLNLLAVDGPTNGRKGDSDAASWLPPAKGYRCPFVARQVAVKQKYGLWMTSAERAATANVLTRCSGQRLPAAKAWRLGGGTAKAAPRPADVSYANCTEVRAAGAAPIHPGDPGFESTFDRDHDGVGCE